jgi:hypothetical protein
MKVRLACGKGREDGEEEVGILAFPVWEESRCTPAVSVRVANTGLSRRLMAWGRGRVPHPGYFVWLSKERGCGGSKRIVVKRKDLEKLFEKPRKWVFAARLEDSVEPNTRHGSTDGVQSQYLFMFG